jgi:transposase
MPAQYVKAYVKRNKHDAADAEAICEAVVRPTMRFVPVKTADQQAAVLLHRGRERLVPATRSATVLNPLSREAISRFGDVPISTTGMKSLSGLGLSRASPPRSTSATYRFVKAGLPR